MPYYAAPGSQAGLTTTYKTALAVYATSGALRRGKIMELILGAVGNPSSTDTPIQWDLSRQTAPGTATAFTPQPVDSADAAAAATAAANATAEGTITAGSSVFNQGANQRQAIRWYAVDESKALIWPASANNGFALRALSPAYTGGVSGQANFIE